MQLLDVHQPGRREHALVPLAVRAVPARLPRAAGQEDAPPLEGRARPAVVDAAHRDHDVLELEPAAGREGRGGAVDYCLRVFEAAGHGAAVDQVESLAEYPGVFGVVDFEAVRGRSLAYGCVHDSGPDVCAYLQFGGMLSCSQLRV